MALEGVGCVRMIGPVSCAVATAASASSRPGRQRHGRAPGSKIRHADHRCGQNRSAAVAPSSRRARKVCFPLPIPVKSATPRFPDVIVTNNALAQRINHSLSPGHGAASAHKSYPPRTTRGLDITHPGHDPGDGLFVSHRAARAASSFTVLELNLVQPRAWGGRAEGG